VEPGGAGLDVSPRQRDRRVGTVGIGAFGPEVAVLAEPDDAPAAQVEGRNDARGGRYR
jgi:hypothetical protein